MKIPDVNVLVGALKPDAPNHRPCSEWLKSALERDESIGLLDAAVTGFIRLVTSPKLFAEPATSQQAIASIDFLLALPQVRSLRASEGYWAWFCKLCRETGARGNLISDIHIAAIALEHGAEVVTMDRDFLRLPPVSVQLLRP
ncbi:TA system VapC family ribonuclease toxin [Hydrocarboniphaga sp.]|uniref:TA system VapC family ribonuclease toxin n=1 Tax=Hydrocarboniphaga sp. TaxID=2033016 RepID=UPI003D0BE388